MSQGPDALTQKERETLRLLVGGHDAKSIARHLGLSVHTVNERLRDARRKMGTSSSREAARLLLDAEGNPPQLLGDKRFGDASAAAQVASSPHRPQGSGSLRRTGWMIGGIAMSLALAFLTFTALSGGSEGAAAPPAAPLAASAAETAAVAAGKQWLALLDAGKWDASYAATGKTFRSLNTLAKWTEVSQRVRTPLGAMLSRELKTVDFVPAPPQGYWIVKFRTDYAGKAGATETLSLAWEDGAWKVAGVTID